MTNQEWGKCARRTLLSAALVMSGLAAAEGPALRPSSERYSVKPGQKATGRAGSATLEVRAMVSKDATVLLEATTGTLDSPQAPPGYLSKLALKLFDGNAELVANREYNGLSGAGYRAYTFTDLTRGQPFQVQANIRGIDGARTDVVTVTGTAVLRPDLELSGIEAPGSVRRGADAVISAVIREANGDVGATGDCVLSVDGTEVDRAPGIWVDAGGAVSCAFTTQFSAAGKREVTVSVAGQVPADDDPTNNTLSAEVTVIDGPQPIRYSAVASYLFTDMTMRMMGTYAINLGTITAGTDWISEYVQRGTWEQASITAWPAAPLSFPVERVEVSFQSGDSAPRSATFEAISSTGGCSSSHSASVGIYLYLCPDSVQASRFAGQVVYFSQMYTRQWVRSPTGYMESPWAINTSPSSSSSTASFAPPSSTYAISLRIQDDGATWVANPTLQLTQLGSSSYSTPLTCTDVVGPFAHRACQQTVSSMTSAVGYASGDGL